jgi:uncharacterized protein YndB with AHSA1/START domain
LASIPHLHVQLFSCVFNLAHTVSRSVLLDAPPEQVWEAIVDPGALGEWLAQEVELEAHEGGELRCRFESGEERRGQIELVEEARRLAFHWRREGAEPSRVEIVLDAVADGTEVTVIESGLRARTPLLGAAWTSSLRRLRLRVGRLVLA